jgi:Domain of unknown function (DUF4168)
VFIVWFSSPMPVALKFVLTVLLCLWCSIASPALSWAATSAIGESSPAESPPKSSSGLDASNIPSEKVSQFVSACLQVVALIDRREGELQAAETESESLRIQQDIEAEAVAIIETAGLNRQEYLQLLGLANVDPEFGERIATLLQEAAG